MNIIAQKSDRGMPTGGGLPTAVPRRLKPHEIKVSADDMRVILARVERRLGCADRHHWRQFKCFPLGDGANEAYRIQVYGGSRFAVLKALYRAMLKSAIRLLEFNKRKDSQ